MQKQLYESIIRIKNKTQFENQTLLTRKVRKERKLNKINKEKQIWETYPDGEIKQGGWICKKSLGQRQNYEINKEIQKGKERQGRERGGVCELTYSFTLHDRVTAKIGHRRKRENRERQKSQNQPNQLV